MAFLMFLTLASVAVPLLRMGIGWLRAIPDAHAWDPNSHDKIVSHAIELLATGASGPKKTLLGWMLSECRRQQGNAAFFLTNMEMQIRRGAVEEDMNSSILTHLLYDNTGKDCLEGSNGGYHFYTPKNPVHGLTDCSWLPYIFGQVGSGCTSPMPSALVRATAPEDSGLDPGGMSVGKFFVPLPVALCFSGVAAPVAGGLAALAYWDYCLTDHYSEWHMDEEGRNYSFSDSRTYWDKGYSHLAFYAIGRIAHLLSDMAVPAHVRNDSHAGTFLQAFGFDPSDPVEVYGERTDMQVIGADLITSKDADGKHVYAFSPKRDYSAAQPVYGLAIKGNKGRNSWSQVRQENPRETEELFDKLARDTYEHFYSYNTIPGNSYSHKPEDCEARLPLGKADWDKCDVEMDAVAPFLINFCSDASLFLHPDLARILTAKTHCPIGSSMERDIRYEADQAAGLIQEIQASIKPLGPKTSEIIGMSPRYSPPDLELVKKVLGKLPLWYTYAREYGYQGEIKFIGFPVNDGANLAARHFSFAYDKLQMPTLLEKAGAAKDTHQALRDWIDAPNPPDEMSLAEHLVVTTRMSPAVSHLHGPFCLTKDIVAESYRDRQAAAVAHCAVMFTNWFESLHAGDPKKRGLATWLNKKSENPSAVPEVASIKLLDTHASESVVLETAMVGVANHFPMPLDVTIMIELLAVGTDEDVFKSGVELELDWGTLVPKIGSGFPEEDGTPDTYVRRELLAYLRKLGVDEGVSATYFTKSFDKVTLRGEGDGTKEAKLSHTIEAVAQPYNLEALARLQLPLGEWAQSARHMGGVMRGVEKVKVIGMPIPAWPDDKNGLKRMTASFLHVTATVPGGKPAQPTAGGNPAGGNPAGSNPAGGNPPGGNPAGPPV